VADPHPYPGTPRWLRLLGITVGIAALLFVVLIHGGSGARHTIPFVGSLDHGATHATQASGR